MERDRKIKMPLHARAGNVEYLLIDLDGRNLRMYREPSNVDYGIVTIPAEAKSASPRFLPDV